MRPLPKEMPHTQEEYNELIEIAYENEQETYEKAVAEAKEKVETKWKASYQDNYKTLHAHYEKIADTETKSSKEKVAYLRSVEAEIKETLNKQLEVALKQAVTSITPPMSREHIEAYYEMYKPQDNNDIPDNTPVIPKYSLEESIWKLGDKFHWDIARARLLNKTEIALVDPARIIELAGNPTIENLRENIKLYSAKNPSIKLGPEIMTEEELLASLINERTIRLAEYDTKIMELNRCIRLYPNESKYLDKRNEWDEYAVKVVTIDDQEGSPWDGGGEKTPWPIKPTKIQ